jgi:acyl-CoA synthetase (AMP-forming)/AMP-acid ligase II
VTHCVSTTRRLLESLDSNAISHHGMTFVDDAGNDERISYRELAEQALLHAGALRELGIRENDLVMLALPASVAHVSMLMGCVVLGALPCTVPLPGKRMVTTATHVVDVACDMYRPKLLIATDACAPSLVSMSQRTGVRVIDETALAAVLAVGTAPIISAKADNDAHHVQLTSGSISYPKAAVLSHRNVIANSLGIGGSVGFDTERGDRTASWLPLYHDMGLLTLLSNLHYRSPLLMMQPSSFIRNPLGWLKRVATARATTTSVPTFALRYCVRRFNEIAMAGIDLSACRNIFIGGERVDESTLHAFADTFSPYGLERSALQPCYGMAESTLAVTMHRAWHEGRVDGYPYVIADRIDTRDLIEQRRAVQAQTQDGEAVLAVGTPIPGMDYAIVGDHGDALDDRHVGEVSVRGTSVMLGYLNAGDGSLTTPFNPDGWFATGDIGYAANGQLFILGRKKEIIIIRGCNYFPHEIEEALGTHRVMQKGNCIAFGLHDEAAGTERLIVAVETRPADATAKTRAELQTLLQQHIGFSAQEIVFVEAGGLPRTTSGKLQRLKCKAQYEAGTLAVVETTVQPVAPEIITLPAEVLLVQPSQAGVRAAEGALA